ncbi:hypothetical protein tb265_17140 [Gemmatimonadetes bacterium T265]|nr:hypothetical protein tb265_17140 [Gemmatimonadetes bacterium T265]
MTAPRSVFEEIPVAGHKLVETVRALVRAGSVRRIVVRNAADRVVLDVPLTAGVVGAALLPFWAALGGLAALSARYTVVVERDAGAAPGT